MEAIRNYFEQLTPLDDTAWAAMKGRFRRETFIKRTQVLSEGQVCPFVAFIESGLFRFYHLKDGNEKVTAFFFFR